MAVRLHRELRAAEDKAKNHAKDGRPEDGGPDRLPQAVKLFRAIAEPGDRLYSDPSGGMGIKRRPLCAAHSGCGFGAYRRSHGGSPAQRISPHPLL